MTQRIEVEDVSADEIERIEHPILADVLRTVQAPAEDGRGHVEGGHQKSWSPTRTGPQPPIRGSR